MKIVYKKGLLYTYLEVRYKALWSSNKEDLKKLYVKEVDHIITTIYRIGRGDIYEYKNILFYINRKFIICS